VGDGPWTERLEALTDESGTSMSYSICTVVFVSVYHKVITHMDSVGGVSPKIMNVGLVHCTECLFIL